MKIEGADSNSETKAENLWGLKLEISFFFSFLTSMVSSILKIGNNISSELCSVVSKFEILPTFGQISRIMHTALYVEYEALVGHL